MSKSEEKETTKEHFELFKIVVLEHITKLGLHDWRVEILHTPTDSGEYASTDHNLENHCAIIKLNTKWEEDGYLLNDENIKTTAKHEVHHLLLARLAAYAQYRFVNKIMLNEAEEGIIRVLDKYL